MPWLMPSFGRPDAPARLLDAPGGMPADVVILVNEDDPRASEYPQDWQILKVPAGSRFADAVRHAFQVMPDEAYYGIIDDDYWPITPEWWDLMVAAAGTNGVAIANNRQNFPKPYCCRVMGGELARAIGTIAPGMMRHNYSDDAWAMIAEKFGVYRPLEHVIVEHRHHSFRKEVAKDATYERGSADLAEDRRLFDDWTRSPEFIEQCRRVATLLGGTISTMDPKSVHLAVCLPVSAQIDPAYHHSFTMLQMEASRTGMPLREVSSHGGSHVAKARERVLWDAWKHNPTHLLYIDADMGYSVKAVMRLLLADVEFACAVGMKKQDEPALACNFFTGDQILHPVNRFLKIKEVGFAFVLLKRSVIEKMVAAYPELEYDAGPGKVEHALFLDMIDKRERLGEDYSFCRRWAAIGGEIWADRYASLVHAGRKEYTGCIDDFFKGKENVNMDIIDGRHAA